MSRLNTLGCAMAAALTACAGSTANQGGSQDTCPAEISVSQALRSSPAGWESVQRDTTARLVAVSIFDGPPKHMADLVPDAMTNPDGHRISKWLLSANSKRGYWLSCSYDRTNIVLSHAIAPSVSVVEVTYDLGVTIAGMPGVLNIAFR